MWHRSAWSRAALGRRRQSVWLLLAVLIAGGPGAAAAADLDATQLLYQRGEYERCLEECRAAIDSMAYGEAWHVLKADVEMTTGDYPAARATLEAALLKYTWSVKLRVRLREAMRFTGEADRVPEINTEIARLVEASPWRYTDAENLVLLGWLALELGGDAREVQESFFQRARRNNPVHRLPRLALGRLALEKRDFQFASEIFREALKSTPDDLDLLFGLAEALAGSDPEEVEKLEARIVELNPRYVPLLRRRVDRSIEAEEYDAAEQELSTILGINPRDPAALAYWAVIAHLRNESRQETELRTEALATWATNPEVDHIIGRELSQKYRFREGAAHQRQALAFDAHYLPARKQLAQDLLRLGDEEAGWQLVDEAFQSDQYDITIYNLITLRDSLSRFATLETEGFIVRMDAHEAEVYGPRVLELLAEARSTLPPKYGVELQGPVLVEIFPHPADFAVRTFGMPGVAGYLGVCFGNVITANSPASQAANPANWESVLWHEFAHVVTLNLTHNRMPRWVSEGISVYEERQRDPAWGERLTPAYREFILGHELTPISQLSGAFLNPKSMQHIAFAYYESSLVIEYLIETYGFEALQRILGDLGAGVYINDALERHTVPLPTLEAGFEEYAHRLARQLGPDVDWSEPILEGGGGTPDVRLKQFLTENPNNYNALRMYSNLLVKLERWSEAEPLLVKLLEIDPRSGGSNGTAAQLAEVQRRLGREREELATLTRWAELDDAALPAYQRLIELGTRQADWETVRLNAVRWRAVDPLVPQPHRALADAAEKLGDDAQALAALRSLQSVSGHDTTETHLRLARILHRQGADAEARRHLLQSLEAAPRYRDAQRLLLEIVGEPSAQPTGSAPPR